MGIDTLIEKNTLLHYKSGNEEKPEWALTHRFWLWFRFCGNEEKPEWALTHIRYHFLDGFASGVEMKRSPKWK